MNKFNKQIERVFRQVSYSFLKNTGDYVSSLSEKIFPDKANNSISDLSRICLISAFSNLVKNKAKRLDTSTSILTKWENLGTITAEIIKNSIEIYENRTTEIQFYALQLKSPLEYLTYPFVNGIDEEKKQDWAKYLQSQIDYSKKNINIYRYFAVVDDNVVSNLKELYGIDGDHEIDIPEITRLKKKDITKELNKDIDIEQLEGYFNKETINEFKSKKVKKILGEVIHRSEFCYARIFNKNDFKKLLMNYDFTNHRGPNKPYDYLAIRIKENYDNKFRWVFCLESVYDTNLDVADITIYYMDDPDNSVNYSWKQCSKCNNDNNCDNKCYNNKIYNRQLKLNEIFFGDKFCSNFPDESGKCYDLRNGEKEIQPNLSNIISISKLKNYNNES